MTNRHITNLRSGYTLLEVMVVVVMMGMVAMVMIPRFVGMTSKVSMDRLIAEIVHLDTRSRQLAQQGHWCMMQRDEQSNELRLMQGRSDPQLVQRLQIDPSYTVMLSLDRIVFNTLGQTDSYSISISHGEISKSLRFNGLTGWHEVADAAR